MYQPDVLILIDYPGFNLRIAEWAKKQGFKIVYYISPQIWAWKENRIHGIKRTVDKMLVILPFEKEFYAKWNFEAEYVGHPLVEVIHQFLVENKKETDVVAADNIIALLPGSRKQEILKKLPIMLQVAAHFPTYQFVVAKAPGLPDDFYNDLMLSHKNVSAVLNQTYDLLSKSRAALVTSGTATLETALFGVPEVICYKGSNISYQIAKRVIKIKYICLVNLIMNKEVVKELIQDEMNETNLVHELKELLTNTHKQKQLKEDYDALKTLLSAGGNASRNAALSIWEFIR